MLEITGQYGKAKIMTDEVEQGAMSQIYGVLNHPISAVSNIVIQPDVHQGTGCVIGYTQTRSNCAVPNLVGVDIGCGVLGFRVGKMRIGLDELDRRIKAEIPYGFAHRKRPLKGGCTTAQ